MPTKYAHTNLIAKDWRRLLAFYQEVFGCVPVPPERNLSGEWLDKATGLTGSHLSGMHLRLPGYGDDGPTLEIFQYGSMPEHPTGSPNTPGYAHIEGNPHGLSHPFQKAKLLQEIPKLMRLMQLTQEARRLISDVEQEERSPCSCSSR